MTKRFMVTHIGDDGETILSHGAETDEVIEIVVDDLMTSEALKEVAECEDDRRLGLIGLAALCGLQPPRLPEQIRIESRNYRIEELPDDPVALDEFYTAKLLSPKLLKFIYRVPGKLRIEIWPNESQHRGLPHCRVSNRSKSASFTIPDGALLVGDLRPDEREATMIVRQHGEELLSLWHLMRPDDQRL